MDDLIVIILTLIVAVAGTIGQIKKKKQPQPQPEDPQKEKPDNFWTFLDEFETQPQTEHTNITTPEEKEEVNTVKKEYTSYTFNPVDEGQNSIIENGTIQDDIKTIIEEEGKKEKILEGFSLRKAVIYSEILNRKYS